jgi:4'-phosphopantetheinyl transferase
LQLRPGEIAVWWMELSAPSADVMARWRTCLDPAEQAQADRFHFEEDRSTYTAAHWLVRNALAAVGGAPPAAWRFVIERKGKPRVDPAAGLPELRFNLSHTRDLVACVINLDTEVGIDVETLDRKSADLAIAKRFFSATEFTLLRDTPPDRQHDTFFRLWTLKEAFIKATGEGMSRGLDSFSFTLDPVSISFRPQGTDEPTQWTFIEQRPTPGHLLAIAARYPEPVKLLLHPVRQV